MSIHFYKSEVKSNEDGSFTVKFPKTPVCELHEQNSDFFYSRTKEQHFCKECLIEALNLKPITKYEYREFASITEF